MMKPNNIAQQIRHIRRARGLNQTAMADSLGISTPAYSKIESGITDVNLSRLQQIADVFGVPLIALFGDAEQVPAERTDTGILRDIEARETEILELQRKIIDLYEELRNGAR